MKNAHKNTLMIPDLNLHGKPEENTLGIYMKTLSLPKKAQQIGNKLADLDEFTVTKKWTEKWPSMWGPPTIVNKVEVLCRGRART